MKINVRQDSVEIEGYVNSIERNSKPLMSRMGQFIERICKGAFKKAIQRNDDIHILLNHDWSKDLGSTKKGNLELEEDNIGLKARATITDPEVIKKARQGDLVGWSFGFTDRDVEGGTEKGLPLREVKDLDLYEVSLLDRTKTPAYDGTLVMARDDGSENHFIGETFIDEDNSIIEEEKEPTNEPENDEEQLREEQQPKEEAVEKTTPEEVPKQQEIVEKNIDYSKYDAMVKEMKEE